MALMLLHFSPTQCDARAGASCRLWIAADDRGREAPNLRALAHDLGLADSIRWLGLRTDLPAVLDAADAFVLSSAWEGMPLALGEAMAMEKTFVATNVGGVSELAGDTGFLVAAKDATALAQSMLACMELPREARQALGRSARTRIVSAFNIDTKADEWQSLYALIAGR
jgi:glycosyltransferase involved in cell wall biosynthesis